MTVHQGDRVSITEQRQRLLARAHRRFPYPLRLSLPETPLNGSRALPDAPQAASIHPPTDTGVSRVSGTGGEHYTAR